MTLLSSWLDEETLFSAIAGSSFWESYLMSAIASKAARIHLAVFTEPYFSYILDGSKSVESRFSKNASAPYQRVDVGDVLLLKRTGGQIEAVCYATDVWFYRLAPANWSEIREKFLPAMRVSEEFIAGRAEACYASLIRVSEVERISPLAVRKKDRRGWVVLHDPVAEARSAASQLSIAL